MPVLFIAGLGRSGSTLLASLLAQVDGLCSVGELRYLLERGVIGGDRCGCGGDVDTCSFWADVIARSGQPVDAASVTPLLAQEARVARLRQAWRLPADRARGYPWLRREAPEWLDHLLRTHRSLHQTTGCVVVDSSKLPSYGAALEATGGIDLKVVHLVRDPRGVAHSWSRATPRHDRHSGASMDHRDPYSAALLWSGWNEVAHRLWRGNDGGYTVMHYEQLVAQPARTIRRALDELDLLPSADLSFISGTQASVSPSHSVAGNPARMRAGLVDIKIDDRWRSDLAARPRMAVGVLTAPTRRRYAS